VDLQALIALAGPLREWLVSLRLADREDSALRSEAVAALYAALNETRIYLGTLAESQLNTPDAIPRDRETEARLSRLWTAASVKLRSVNRDLAERCLLKGDSWAMPERWPKSTVHDARIDIEEIFNEARALL
jgi:hypothetical protein